MQGDRTVITAQALAALVLCVLAYLLFLRADGPAGLTEITAPGGEAVTAPDQQNQGDDQSKPGEQPDGLAQTSGEIPKRPRAGGGGGGGDQATTTPAPPGGSGAPTDDQYSDTVRAIAARIGAE